MKYFMMFCAVGLMMSSSIYGQTTSGLSYELVSTNNSPRLTSYNEKTYNFNGRDTKFKKNRRTINYTALGFLVAGAGMGYLMWVNFSVPVVFGVSIGASAAFLTLIIAHPINRYVNKGKALAYLQQPSDDIGMHIELGIIDGGLGFALRF